MNFSELIEHLQVTLESPLRDNEKDEILKYFLLQRGKTAPGLLSKKSSVLLFFYPKQNLPHLLLIKRSVYKGAHSGQIAFPGGKQEPDDVDAIHTAVREAREEVAINAPNIIGVLSDIHVPVSRFDITPVVGYANSRPNFIPEEREVADIIEVPVKSIADQQLFQYGPVEVNKEMKLETFFFNVGDHIVWGATAMIIAELRNFLFRKPCR